MKAVRSAFAAAAIFAIAASGAALAQETTPPSTTPAPSSEPASKTPSKVDEVSKWSSRQWNRAKAQFAKEKNKWTDCQKQSKDQKLTGRKSWSFLYSCMTNS
jgi:hypothetical protein